MKKSELAKFGLPNSSGIYLFKRGSEILYVGKATSLKSRVQSYFSSDLIETRGERIVAMVTLAKSIAYEETDSVLEALILEANYIKKYQPVYNVRERDNKSYNYVVVTDEAFPRLLVVRGRELFSAEYNQPITDTFGPYTEGKNLRIAMGIIRKIFPYRDTCEPNSGKPCFNAQIHLCPGVCSGAISQSEYHERIVNIKQLLSGKKKTLLKELTRKMKGASAEQKFELASELHRQVSALTHIRDVSLIRNDERITSDGGYQRIESYDISHTGGTQVVGALVSFIDGVPDKSAYRKFILKNQANNDIANLQEILSRRLLHTEWRYPDIIVLDGGEAQRSAGEAIVRKFSTTIDVFSVVKNAQHVGIDVIAKTKIDEKMKSEIIKINSETHRFVIAFHRKRRSDAFLPKKGGVGKK